jgi:hypothetical protein
VSSARWFVWGVPCKGAETFLQRVSDMYGGSREKRRSGGF